MRCKPVLFTILAAAGAVPGLAQDSSAGCQLGGFGTLGVAATTTNKVGYPRGTFQPSGATHRLDPETDSRLGLQLRLPLGESLFGTLQAVPIPVRRHLQARHHLGDPDLESGFDLHGARRPGELRVVRENCPTWGCCPT